jgi:hypothetical protein
MLLDISGNSFTSLGATSINLLPTVTYNPKQLYGNDLYVWVDMTDWRTMYNTTTGNTNISSTGCVALTGSSDTNPNHTNVRRLEDLACNFTGSNNSRKFYTWPQNAGLANINRSSALPADSGVTGTTNLFINNQIDTNKGFFSGFTFFAHPIQVNSPIDFLAPNSAVTICSYMPSNVLNPGSGNASIVGLSISYYLNNTWFGFANAANSPFTDFIIPTGSSQSFTRIRITSGITSSGDFFGKTIMLTGVICGRTWDVYINNKLISSGTLPSQVTYPFSAAPLIEAPKILMSASIDLAGIAIKNTTPRSIWEGFIANSYTSPQQINLLYDYFRVKFKDRTYDLF